MSMFCCFFVKNKIKILIKSRYNRFIKEISEIEEFNDFFKKRFYSKIISQKEKPKRMLGQNGILYLLRILVRSKYIYEGFINSINNHQILPAYLLNRAHYENTAAIAYFLYNLKKFYKGKITYSQLDNDVLLRLSLGEKGEEILKKQPKEYGPIKAINIITMMEKVGKVFSDKDSKELNETFKKAYDMLSEFCHPNWSGISMFSEIDEKRVVHLKDRYFLQERDLGILLNTFHISLLLFEKIYDKTFSILKENEETPILKR